MTASLAPSWIAEASKPSRLSLRARHSVTFAARLAEAVVEVEIFAFRSAVESEAAARYVLADV